MRNSLTVCLATAALLCSPTVRANEIDPPRFAVGVSYFGEMVAHPGAVAFAELTLANHGDHAVVATAGAGFYRHPAIARSAVASLELGYRYTAPFGGFAQISAGPGYLRSWFEGRVVEAEWVDNALAFRGVRDQGRGYFMPSAALRVGWEIAPTPNSRLRPFAGARILAQHPVNTWTIWRIAAEAGVSGSIGGSRE